MLIRLFLLFISSFGLIYKSHGKTKNISPRKDSAHHLFRYAPMQKSTRSIVTYHDNGLRLAFDSEKLRSHTVWIGNLDLFGPQYTNSKRPFISKVNGKILFENPPFLPWRIDDPTINSDWSTTNLKGQFLSTRTYDNHVDLNYLLSTIDDDKIIIR